MADRNKFEEMLERLVNEDKAGAEELFHEIVVEKSRDIYEGLLESDLEDEIDETTDEEVDETKDEEVDEATDEEVDEAKDEEVDEANDEEVDEAKDEETNEEFDLDEFEVAEEDPTDDMMKDMEGGDDADMDMDMDMDDEGDSDEDIEDRVVDLEDALDDLKAEFEKMMSDDDEGGDDMDMDDEGMGLGLFIANILLERNKGKLKFSNVKQKQNDGKKRITGAKVEILWDRSSIEVLQQYKKAKVKENPRNVS